MEHEEHEFNILVRMMEKNLEMRHTYLMFAFTTSMAALAVLFIVDFAKNIMPWICMIPFSVIIPFQARISYSRLTHAKMEAYVVSNYPKQFTFLKTELNELSGILGKFIAIIVNYELTLLSFFIDILYITIQIYIIGSSNFVNINSFVMLICTGIVFSLATYTFPYIKFVKKFITQYNDK